MKDKTLWIIAGANGSGKTSLVQHYSSRFKNQIPFISPDDIAKELDDKYDGKDTSLIQKAGRETISRQAKYFKEGKSFGYETTFSSKRDLRIISQSKKDGYEIKLVFVGLETSADNIIRVAERVQKGGHFVAPKDIIRRYDRALRNLLEALDLADKIYIFDNSKIRPKMICRIRNKKIIRLSPDLPKWVKDTKIGVKLKSLETDINIKSKIESSPKRNGGIHPSPYKYPFKKPF